MSPDEARRAVDRWVCRRGDWHSRSVTGPGEWHDPCSATAVQTPRDGRHPVVTRVMGAVDEDSAIVALAAALGLDEKTRDIHIEED